MKIALLIILKITIIVFYLDFVICFIKILLKLKTLLFKNLLAGSTAEIYRITRSTFCKINLFVTIERKTLGSKI